MSELVEILKVAALQGVVCHPVLAVREESLEGRSVNLHHMSRGLSHILYD